MRRLRVINSGGSRTAFEMANAPSAADGGTVGAKFVYKTIKFNKDITAQKMDEQRKDSLIMERTTKSMFIPDIHGYCSLAVMMDFMPEGESWVTLGYDAEKTFLFSCVLFCYRIVVSTSSGLLLGRESIHPSSSPFRSTSFATPTPHPGK